MLVILNIIVTVTVQVVIVDNQNKNKRSNLALKIIIPIVVVAIIAGIWFFKTNERSQEIADFSSSVNTTLEPQETDDSNTIVTTAYETTDTTTSNSSEITTDESQETASSSSSTTDTSQKTTNSDFSLAASKIDLEKLKSFSLPIIIDFGADECIPCKEMAPVLKKLNQEWQGKVIVKFVDVWKYPDAVADFPVQMIPTQFFFDAQGKPFVPADPEGMQMQMYVMRETEEHVYTAHVGGMTEEQIRAVFEEMGIK